jgi:hypothetical protein
MAFLAEDSRLKEPADRLMQGPSGKPMDRALASKDSLYGPPAKIYATVPEQLRAAQRAAKGYSRLPHDNQTRPEGA